MHGGLVDPHAIGRKGGQASVAAKRSTLAGALRERGRAELEKLLADPDPRIRLRAASVVAAYSPERVPTESGSLPYWSTRCKHCGQLSESQFGRTMPMPSFGDILAAALESHGVLELQARCVAVTGHGRGREKDPRPEGKPSGRTVWVPSTARAPKAIRSVWASRSLFVYPSGPHIPRM